jgi:trk system potassium uptake protein TrkA
VKVVIVGAGSVGSSIARELLAHKHEILLIDLKPEVIGRSGLRGAHWLVGDACELSTLQDAKLEDADVVVSATGDDKVNLVVSLLAKTEFGVGRTVGRVNNPKNDWMFNDSWGVDVAVNTPQLMTALVEEAVEIGDLVRLLTLQTGVSSLVEFTVPHDSHAIGLTVGSIDWPEDSTLVAILRDQAPITPSRDDVIDGGDELFFVTTIAAEDQLRELLSPGSSHGPGSIEGPGSIDGEEPSGGLAPSNEPSDEAALPSNEARPQSNGTAAGRTSEDVPAPVPQTRLDQSLDDDGFDG